MIYYEDDAVRLEMHLMTTVKDDYGATEQCVNKWSDGSDCDSVRMGGIGLCTWVCQRSFVKGDSSVKFVCKQCTEGKHDECPGGTWCDCQHRTSNG